MKKIVALFTSVLLLFIYSCDKADNTYENGNNSSEKIASKPVSNRSINGGVNLQCIGSCDCAFGFDLKTGKGECTCSPCAFEIKFETINDRTLSEEDKNILKDNLFNSELFQYAIEDIKKYAIEKYNFNLDVFKKIELYHNDGTDVVIFSFLDNENNLQSVLYSRSNTISKAFRVDCTGGFECREQYNFNTNTASCSCSDCSMTVTEIKDLTINPS
ncbi:hypothetical protein SAMN02927937_01111 [Paenimyroides aquimaris]|uniref:Lipoprotein n=1 Tax=Paenimyroides marinum TaxID=1159016 RepID=A0A1H6KD53_9FLAO|nr:hypothetical protein [Paenimyroides aquimaris]SEH73013.1 hypothetical protein SAMN02927937_01111 [Paenimyroides aquimaris]